MLRAARVFVASTLVCLASGAHSAPLAQAVLVDTFDSPIYVTAAPGQPTLLFVVEQTGRVQVLKNEVKQATPFLDISSLVSCCGEQGLLSIAFAPDYATSRLFYVAFTNETGDLEVDEFKRYTNLRALPGSRRKVITVRHREAGNHNGGQLQFGPDGFLYISTGDGGEVFPRGKYSRDPRSLLGKILRINPKKSGQQPYTIPPGNPYVGTNFRHEIYSYGLRNPWRFSFDGQRIIIGDVGQSSEEEVNFLSYRDARRANFGWPEYEGNSNFGGLPGADEPLFPMHAYSHDNGGCAVIGGYVSRDSRIPALAGRYIYGDFCTGQVRSFVPDVAGQRARGDTPIGIVADGLSGFGVGPDKRMYLTQTSGELKRIDPPPP